MKTIEINLDGENWVSPNVVAAFCGVTDEWIRQRCDDGSLDHKKVGKARQLDLIPSVLTFWTAKVKANEPVSQSDDQRKTKADADWKEAKAEIEQMKRDELKGALHSSEDVAEITTDLVMAVRAELLSLPGTCAVDCADARTAAEASGIIKEAVNNILNTLSRYEYDPAKYKALVKERETWIQNGKEEDDQ